VLAAWPPPSNTLTTQVRRRLPKRVYVPLPDAAARRAMIAHLLRGQRHALSPRDLERVVMGTGAGPMGLGARVCKQRFWSWCRSVGPTRRHGNSSDVRGGRAFQPDIFPLGWRLPALFADGYSGSDLAALCKEAAMIAIRELGPAIATAPADAVRVLAATPLRCSLFLIVQPKRCSSGLADKRPPHLPHAGSSHRHAGFCAGGQCNQAISVS
jgi:SpoVK/Ycf46/Vps4 family AAA+-type ATPase